MKEVMPHSAELLSENNEYTYKPMTFFPINLSSTDLANNSLNSADVPLNNCTKPHVDILGAHLHQ